MASCLRLFAWSKRQSDPVRRPTSKEVRGEAKTLANWLVDFKRHYVAKNAEVVTLLDDYYGVDAWRVNQSTKVNLQQAIMKQVAGAQRMIDWSKLQTNSARRPTIEFDARGDQQSPVARIANWYNNFRRVWKDPVQADLHAKAIGLLDAYYGTDVWKESQMPEAYARQSLNKHIMQANNTVAWSKAQKDDQRKPLAQSCTERERELGIWLNNFKKLKDKPERKPVCEILIRQYGHIWDQRQKWLADKRALNNAVRKATSLGQVQ